MHSVADRIPQSEQIHERADRLSESAEKHCRRAQHSRDDDDETGWLTAPIQRRFREDLPAFEQITANRDAPTNAWDARDRSSSRASTTIASMKICGDGASRPPIDLGRYLLQYGVSDLGDLSRDTDAPYISAKCLERAWVANLRTDGDAPLVEIPPSCTQGSR